MIQQVSTFDWCHLTIEVTYTPEWSKAASVAYGEPLALLEIRTVSPAKAPMPISGTGYRSIFLLDSEVEAEGGSEKFARAVLDAAARDKKWQAHEEQARQYSLF